MNLNKKAIFIFILLNTKINLLKSDIDNFDKLWEQTRNIYQELVAEINKDIPFYVSRKYTTSYWFSMCQELKNLLSEPKPIKEFLKFPPIACNMIRGINGEFGLPQKFEESYLLNCVSETNKKRFKDFANKNEEPLAKCSKEFNCSSTTLGHLFYLAKVLENSVNEPNKIVQLGGQYGNFAKITKQILPKCTFIIFDLPELLAIQNLFLSCNAPDIKLKIHKNDSTLNNLESEYVHLIPIYLMEKFNSENIDVFVSTFALSETPEFVQKLVIKKNFLNSKLVYLTGQLNGWSENDYYWIPDHKNLLSSVRNQYKFVNCVPFHINSELQNSFELIAHN